MQFTDWSPGLTMIESDGVRDAIGAAKRKLRHAQTQGEMYLVQFAG